MVCDLDGFKKINDQHGHLEGNRVLKAFAQALREHCREYDYVARMGGDEFVIVIPGMNRHAALDKASHLRTLASDAGRSTCGADYLSVSIGTSSFNEDGRDAEQLLAEADRRMYIAKRLHHEQVPEKLVAETADTRPAVN
jgi:diguanylate cyclase (GGDEF)-like protein